MQYCDWFINRNDKFNGRTKWTLLEHEANKSGVTLGVEVPQWSANVHLNVGRFLFNIIVNDLKFDSSLFKKKKNNRDTPAFFKIFRHSGIMLIEEVTIFLIKITILINHYWKQVIIFHSKTFSDL